MNIIWFCFVLFHYCFLWFHSLSLCFTHRTWAVWSRFSIDFFLLHQKTVCSGFHTMIWGLGISGSIPNFPWLEGLVVRGKSWAEGVSCDIWALTSCLVFHQMFDMSEFYSQSQRTVPFLWRPSLGLLAGLWHLSMPCVASRKWEDGKLTPVGGRNSVSLCMWVIPSVGDFCCGCC